MTQDFYTFCKDAKTAAEKGDKEATVKYLTLAYIIAEREMKLARRRVEISTLTAYRKHLNWTVHSCEAAFGLRAPPDFFDQFYAAESSSSPPPERSSIEHRWEIAEIPETYLPFAWPRLYPGSL